jgi:hypothetical protein
MSMNRRDEGVVEEEGEESEETEGHQMRRHPTVDMLTPLILVVFSCRTWGVINRQDSISHSDVMNKSQHVVRFTFTDVFDAYEGKWVMSK